MLFEGGGNYKDVNVEGTHLEFSINTFANREFLLRVNLFTTDSAIVFFDSMKIYINGNPINYFINSMDGKENAVELQIMRKQKYFSYGFKYDHELLKKGDRITIVADDFIESHGKFFSIEPIHFFIKREY